MIDIAAKSANYYIFLEISVWLMALLQVLFLPLNATILLKRGCVWHIFVNLKPRPWL